MVTKANAQGAKRVAAAPSAPNATSRRVIAAGPQANLSILGGSATTHRMPQPPSASSLPSAARVNTGEKKVVRIKETPRDVALWRRWFCSDVALSKILFLVGSRMTAATVVPPMASSCSTNASAPLPIGALSVDRLRLGVAALERALHLVAQSSVATVEAAAVLQRQRNEEVASLVDVAEAAVPFLHSVAARRETDRSHSEPLSGGTHDVAEAAVVHRVYAARDIAMRLANVRRVGVVRDAWQLGRVMRLSVPDMQQGLAAYVRDAMRLRSRGAGTIGAVGGAAASTVVVALLDIVVQANEPPPPTTGKSSRSGRSAGGGSNTNQYRSAADDVRHIVRSVVQLLTTACQPDPDAWGIRPGDRSAVARPLCVDGGLWFEVGSEWCDVLTVALKQRELLGLPPFLRSVKRQQQAAVATTATSSAPSVTSGGGASQYGGASRLPSLFPTVRHLDPRSFDLGRHVTGDFDVIDDELRNDVCFDALSFVAIAGDVDMMSLLLWDYLTCPAPPMQAARLAPYLIAAHQKLVAARRRQQQDGDQGVATSDEDGGATATLLPDEIGGGGACPPIAASWVPGSQPLHSIPFLVLLFGVCEERQAHQPVAYLCAAMELRHMA